MGNESSELAQLRARVGRLETLAWVDRAVLGGVLALLWDEIPGVVVVIGAFVLFFVVVFSLVERVRALR